uniref:Uncharacterized protein n=1 Tax=Pseudomonas fluorescens TaxID=294 RepID=A0A5E6XAJ0_PSEFL|nr:hypothetical protein PS652_05223 [Pseudomonas fluorescens]
MIETRLNPLLEREGRCAVVAGAGAHEIDAGVGIQLPVGQHPQQAAAVQVVLHQPVAAGENADSGAGGGQ